MKNLKNLISAGLIGLGSFGFFGASLLPMKSNAQIFKNSAGEIFNLTDTLEKYNNNKNYLVERDYLKFGNANNPSGHQNTISISRKGGLDSEITLKFDDRKKSVGDFIIDPGYLSYKTLSFKEINEDSLLCTSIEKFYGERPSSNPKAYAAETRSSAIGRKSKDELVIKDPKGNSLHYLFLYNKQRTAYDKVVYSAIINGVQIIIKDSLYDKKLDYYSVTPITKEKKDNGRAVFLKTDTEIENSTKEKDGTTKEEIYAWRDYFENARFYSFKQDISR